MEMEEGADEYERELEAIVEWGRAKMLERFYELDKAYSELMGYSVLEERYGDTDISVVPDRELAVEVRMMSEDVALLTAFA